MRTSVLFILSLMAAHVVCTHYRGGTFYWEKLGNMKIRIYWRLAFQRKVSYPEYFCEKEGDSKTAEDILTLTCTDCTPKNTILSPLTLKCVSISRRMEWNLLDGYIDYKADHEKFTTEFKLIDGNDCTVSSWLKLENYGSGLCWSLLTKVDTSIENNSPKVTGVLPVYRVRRGCGMVIDLNPTDKDGDPIKCRWATGKECPRTDAYYDKAVCDQPTKSTILNEKECTIKFTTGNGDTEGWYAASVMIEDFTDTTYRKPKSAVPFQFLLEVIEDGSCVRPTIDVEACSIINPGETWSSGVIASLNQRSDASSITEIQSSYPDGMSMTFKKGWGLNKRTVKAELEFTPQELGTYTYSFSATDDNGIQSQPKSGRVIVSWEGSLSSLVPPELLEEQSIPAVNSSYEGTDAYWQLKFTDNITRPEKKSFITILEKDSMKVVAKYNARNDKRVIFSKTDPTVVLYPRPTGLKDGKAYLVKVDSGFGVRISTTKCGNSLPNPSEAEVYLFDIPKPSEPTVQCGNSYIKVRIPKAYVNNIPASDLHLHDPKCKITEFNVTHYYVEFGYDECGTVIKRSLPSSTEFYNTIRDDPIPIYEEAPVTRDKRNVEMQIICEMTGIGVADVFFRPNASVKPEKYKAVGEFKTYIKMYADSSYTNEISGTAEVNLNEMLYFAAHSISASKEDAIKSCKAMAKYGTNTEFDKKYKFIKNGCPDDSSVKLTSSGRDHRFSIKSFAFLQHGLTNEVFMKCKMVTCSIGNSNSHCTELKSNNCKTITLHSLSGSEEETDTFMVFKM